MGQGRKKSGQSNVRSRRRSISYDTESVDSEIMRFLKAHSPTRSGSFLSRQRCRESTPAPSLFSPCCRHDSLVEYTSNLPVKGTSIMPSENAMVMSELPLITTSPLTVKTVPEEALNVSDQVNNFYLCIFPNNVIYMNGKGKDISMSMKSAILKICVNLHEEGLLRFCEVAYIEKERKDYVRYCVFPKIQRILSILFHECRYENIYGLSPHSYLILGLCNCLSELVQKAHHILYETLLDFYECERMVGDATEDDFYLKKAEYGQIHRLVEIWQTFVNSFYEKYSVYIFSHKTEENPNMKLLSGKFLYKSLFVLMRISGVVSKYRSLLLSGILKLFYIDKEEIHTFFKVVLAKWPSGTSKKALAMLDLLEEILIECKILINPEFERDLTEVIVWLTQLVNQSHAEIAHRCLNILNNKFILINYVVNHDCRVRAIETSLNNNQNYWNEVIKQMGDDLFDHLLDYV